MAVLGKIRALGPVALISVIGLALFAFVFSTGTGTVTDAFKSDEFNQSRVAIVNGIEMDRSDFMRNVDNIEQQNRGSRSSIQTMNSVWESELKKLILQSEYEKIGISVEREMMRDLLRNNLSSFADFQNDNSEFDEQILNQFISNLKEISPETIELQGSLVNYESWNNFENSVASQGLEQLYYNLIDAGIHTSLFEGEESHYNSNDLVDFRYVKIPFSSITDDEIKITKSDVNEYINDNESVYSSDPTRDLIYVRFDEKPSETDESDFMTALEELTEDRVEYDLNSNEKITYKGFKNTENNEDYINTNSAIKFYDSYVFNNSLSPKFADKIFNLDKGGLFGPYKEDGFVKTTKLIDTKILPDSAKVRHILIPYMGSFRSGPNDSKSKDEAKKTADSINNVLKRNRVKFNSLLSVVVFV